MRSLITVWVAAVLVSLAVGCGSKEATPALRELQRVKSGDMDVVMLAPADALPQGKAEFVLEFRSPDGRLRDIGTVRANATMPMAGMPPMFGTLALQPTEVAGRYRVTGDFTMAGTWQINVEWQGPSGNGSTTLRGAVR